MMEQQKALGELFLPVIKLTLLQVFSVFLTKEKIYLPKIQFALKLNQ